MEPLRLHLEDFKSHRNTEIDCTQFNTVLITGSSKYNDRESNGVGKTQIFEAFDYVLFGEYSTKTIDKIVRDGTDKCRVTFDFTTSTGTFRVMRSRSKKSGKSDLRLYELRAEQWQDITQKTVSEAEVELAKIIKISYQAFRNSVLFAQSDLSGLAKGTPEQRRLILKEALNLALYGKLEKAVKEELAKITEQVTCHRTTLQLLGQPEEEIPQLKQNISELKIKLVQLEQDKVADQEALFVLKNQLEIQKSLNLTEPEELKIQLIAQLNLQKKAQISQESLTSELKTKQQAVSKLQQQIAKQTEALQNSIQQHNQLSQRLSERSVSQIQVELEKAITNVANGTALLTQLQDQKTKLQTPFPAGEQCPHCRQHLSPEHKATCLQKVAEELSNVIQNLQSTITRLETAKAKKIVLQKEIVELNKITGALQQLEQEKSTLNLRLEQDQFQLSNTLPPQIERLQQDLTLSVTSITESVQLETKLRVELDKFQAKQVGAQITELELQIKMAETKLAVKSKEISTIITQVGMLSEKLSTKKQELTKITQINKDLKAALQEQEVHQLVTQSFSSGGIPTVIIYTILDDLQVEANNILTQLRPGLELKFSVGRDKADGQQEDTLDLSYRVQGAEREYEQLSGGQKLIIALSLKLGLSLVIQRRLNTNIKFLALDEVDQSLDSASLDALLEVIKQWQSQFKIFVIFHNEYLKTKFQHMIVVENDGVNGSVGKLVTT